ncbi:trans-Golgi network integral membrane protein TGN38-like isoform X2 [Homalodisca vitripennis]|uniref:trans-Golgi network integral membrane protein TGN38-like isoform X2 n=1 Tax=Homalodisca vitripennis TaxID=197043 RepID=UPI001EEBE2AF|nr:trans-Golgi network integral membrane protein TGN38-like isoform X2 [Homalodisca vitripennis]
MLTNLIVFAFLLLYSKALGYESILLQISSGENSCNKKELFSNFSLNEVSQFGVTCDIPTPNSNRVEFLLKDNVIPILCMGMYDVSLRLCNSASGSITQFSDIFPPSTEKFTKLFERLENEGEFSSLDEFCSVTVPSNTIEEPSSNVTSLWWSVLNKQLKKNESCLTTCRTNENNRVHPLCSYIIWSNGIYKNYLKNQEESRSSVLGVGEDQTSSVTKSPPVKENLDLNQPDISKLQIAQKEVTNITQSAPETQALPQKSNIEQATVAELSVNKQDNIPYVIIGPSVPLNEKPTKKSKSSKKHSKTKNYNDVTNSGLIVTGGGKDSKDNIDNKDTNHALSQHDVIGSDTNLLPPQNDDGNNDLKLNPQHNVGNSITNVAQTQHDVGSVDMSKPPPQQGAGSLQSSQLQAKTGDPMVEEDFSYDRTQDGLESDPPISEKDALHNYPGGTEDDDGDDIDIEPEGKVKTTQYSIINSNIDSGAEQGAGTGAKPDPLIEEIEKIQMNDPFVEAEDSNFFLYFLCVAVLTIMTYLVFHNKKKLVALAIEGRKTRGSRRRPNCSNYSKLDCSLEEAMVSNTTASVTHVLY